VASVVLIANGICFAVMTVIFVILGSAADYGNFGRWLLLFLTVVCWVFQYGMLAIRHSNQWPAGMILYIIAYIAYVSLHEWTVWKLANSSGRDTGILCCLVSKTRTLHARCQEGQRRRSQEREDRPEGI
jgi:hypothetical protein